MVYIFVPLLLFIILVGGNIAILSRLFPVSTKSQKKQKNKA